MQTVTQCSASTECAAAVRILDDRAKLLEKMGMSVKAGMPRLETSTPPCRAKSFRCW